MEYLFLCSIGVNRSPTAAAVAANIAQERGLELKTFYGGIDNVSELTPELLEHFQRFDRIFVMEDYMKNRLVGWGIEDGKVVCLNIEDDYVKLEHKLVQILERVLRAEIAFDLMNKK